MGIPQQQKFDHGSGMQTTAKPTHSPAGEHIDFLYPIPVPEEVGLFKDVPDDVLKPVTNKANATYPPDKED